MFRRTTAIIASLGLLNEDVNATPFITSMFEKAIAKDPTYQSKEKSDQVKMEAFKLSETFNRGEIEPDVFKAQLLALLGGIKVEDEEFWHEWNAMVTAGKIWKSINGIRFALGSHQLHLYSNTNTKHAQALALAYTEQHAYLNLTTSPAQLEDLRIFLSYREQTNRLGLIEKIYDKIQEQAFKPTKIVLIAGNPENIQDPMLKAAAQKEVESLTKWAEEKNKTKSKHNKKENNVQIDIVLHDKTCQLAETIKRITSPERPLQIEPQEESTLKLNV